MSVRTVLTAVRRGAAAPVIVLVVTAVVAGLMAAPAQAATPLVVTVKGAQNYGSSSIGWAGTTSVAGVTASGMTCTTVNGGTPITPSLAAGVYTIDGSSCSGGSMSNPNYTIASYSGSTFQVFRVPLTVAADNKSKTYGAANPALTYSISGFVLGQDSSLVTGSPTLSTTATASSAVGSYPITVGTGTLNAPNYFFVTQAGTLTVTPAPLTVTVTGAQTYGSTAIGWAGTTSVNGVTVSGMTCTSVTANGGTPISASLPAGTYTLDGSSCSGGVLSSGNYTIGTYAGSTYRVFRVALTVTAEDKSKTYGAANPSLTYTVTGFANGDDASVVSGTPAISTTATTGSNVGTYPITIGQGSLSATNYFFVFVNGTMTVNPAPVTVTVTGAQNYGSSTIGWSGKTSVAGVTVANMSCSTVGGGTAISPSLAAGAYTLDGSSCSGGALSSANYTIDSYVGSTFTVFRTALTVTADDKSRTYGAANPALTYNVSGFVNGDDASVVSGTPTLSTTASAASNAGTYPITVSAGTLHASNYFFVFVSGTLTVNPAPLTVTVNGAQYYGSSSIGWAGTTSVKGVSVSGMTCTSVNGGTTIDPTLPAGGYPVDGSSCAGGVLSSPNYTIGAYTGGTFTVYRVPLTVTAEDKTRTYGAPNPALTYTITGFVNGDTAAAVSGVPTLATSATASSNVGSYPITVGVGTLHASNYYFVTATGSLTVTPAPVVVTVTGTQTYGSGPSWSGSVPANGVTVSGVSCATVDGGTAVGPSLAAGSHTVDGASCSGGALSSGNYTIGSYAGGSFSVAKAVLTVTADNKTRQYGSANPTFTYVITGFVNNDDGSVVSGSPALTTTASASSNVGTYPINVAVGGLSAANYSFVGASGTLTVQKATLTVTANDATREFGAADPAFGASISGFVNGDTAAVVSGSPAFSTPATATSDPGTYPINPSAGTLAATNYAFAFAPGTLTITKTTPAMATTSKLLSYVSATLTYGAANTPIVGATVTFTAGAANTPACTAVTDATGKAQCTPSGSVHTTIVLSYYTASFAGSADFTAISVKVSL
jgi:hypothetical protein